MLLLCSGVSGYTAALERKKVGADFMTLVSAGGLVKGCICALYCYTAKDFLNIAAKAK